MNNLRAVCKQCMDAAIETWQRDHKDVDLPEGTYLKIRLSGKAPDGEDANEYPWVEVTGASDDKIKCYIDNDIYLLKDKYAYGQPLEIEKDIILNHVHPGDSFMEADKEMQKRIQSVHSH